MRTLIGHMRGFDDATARGAEPPAQTMALLTLMSWLRDARARTAVDADGVLDWIGEHLGARCRLRARHIRGYLDGDAVGTVDQAAALGDDELPTMVWLAAGIVALHGDGDAAWLTL